EAHDVGQFLLAPIGLRQALTRRCVLEGREERRAILPDVGLDDLVHDATVRQFVRMQGERVVERALVLLAYLLPCAGNECLRARRESDPAVSACHGSPCVPPNIPGADGRASSRPLRPLQREPALLADPLTPGGEGAHPDLVRLERTV